MTSSYQLIYTSTDTSITQQHQGNVDLRVLFFVKWYTDWVFGVLWIFLWRIVASDDDSVTTTFDDAFGKNI